MDLVCRRGQAMGWRWPLSHLLRRGLAAAKRGWLRGEVFHPAHAHVIAQLVQWHGKVMGHLRTAGLDRYSISPLQGWFENGSEFGAAAPDHLSLSLACCRGVEAQSHY